MEYKQVMESCSLEPCTFWALFHHSQHRPEFKRDLNHPLGVNLALYAMECIAVEIQKSKKKFKIYHFNSIMCHII